MSKTDELNKLAHAIALSTVKSDIECFCEMKLRSGKHFGKWYSPSNVLPEQREMVANAIRYAELNGLLERHPEDRGLVRIRRTA